MTTKAYKRRKKRRLPERARRSIKYKAMRFEALNCPQRDVMMRPGRRVHYEVEGVGICERPSRSKHSSPDVHRVTCHHCWAKPEYQEAHGAVCGA